MRLYSVMTFVGTRHHNGDHLALRSRERRIEKHRRPIDVEHSLEDRRVVALHLKDLGDATGSLASSVINPPQQPLCLGLFNQSNPSHQS